MAKVAKSSNLQAPSSPSLHGPKSPTSQARDTTVILEGFFMKKKRDDKRSLLSSKYQKRYFQLTADSFIYAKDPQDLKTPGGDVQVFATQELQYVKRMQKVKLEMRFPLRVLRIKAETAEEAEKWEIALQRANMMKVHGDMSAKSPSPIKDATPQRRVNDMATIEADSDDSDTDRPSQKQKQRAAQHGRGRAVMRDLSIRIEESQQPEQSNRPPSPRSMLANPKVGSAMVTTPTRDNVDEDRNRIQASRWSDHSDSDEDSSHKVQNRQSAERVPQAQRAQAAANGYDYGNSPQRLPNQRREPEQASERLTLTPPVPQQQQQQRWQENGPGNGVSGAPSPHARSRAGPAERLVLEECSSPVLRSVNNSPARPPHARGMARGEDAEVLTLSSPSGKPPLPVGSPAGKPPMPRGHPHSPRIVPPSQDDDGRQSSRHSARGPSPMGLRTSSRAPSPATSTANAGHMSRNMSNNTSGTGDDNWLDSDWDSSDEEAAERRGRAAGAIPSPAGTPQRNGCLVMDDDRWDSDEEDEQRTPVKQQMAGHRGQQHVEEPASPARSKQSPQQRYQQGSDDGDEHMSVSQQGNGTLQKGRFKRASAAPASPPPVPSYRMEDPEHEQPAAGVKMDRNFVEEDWDDEDD